CVNAIPQRRGLGSSAGAVMAGLLAARALAGGGPDWPGPAAALTAAGRAPGPFGGSTIPSGRTPERLADGALLALATEPGGPPDNVAACLAGGLTIAWNPGPGPRAVRLE